LPLLSLRCESHDKDTCLQEKVPTGNDSSENLFFYFDAVLRREAKTEQCERLV
jgi:hypothetical protein